MKPSAAKGAPNAPATDPVAAPAALAAAGVTDELKTIDVAPLERLLEIRKEESQLEEFRTRAEQMKDKVQAVVWKRVVDDYNRRVAALEEQATPLKVQVRAEYQKLRALFDRTNAMNEAAELEKSELEFRHAVGEFSKKQLDERLKSPLDVLERCRADLSAIDEQKARFLSAFASEAELESPPAPRRTPPPTPPPEDAVPAPAAADSETDVTVFASNPLLGPQTQATVLAPNPLLEQESDATSVVSADKVAAAAKAPTPQPDPAPAAPPADAAADRTFMLPAAGLLINTESPAPTEYRLAAMNYLGRSDESHVVIARPGVSRRHALIVAGVGSFSIKDLESQNGTYVNGQRITEQSLKDGDQIVIGDTKITFRMPWPSGGQRARA